MMRKAIAISFLVLFSTTTEAGQLLKLPLVFTHYYTHSIEGRSDSFPDFLRQHYIQTRDYDKDKEQDERLPFKTTNIGVLSIVYLVPQTENLNFTPVFSKEKSLIFMAPFKKKNYLKDIFHPPRLV